MLRNADCLIVPLDSDNRDFFGYGYAAMGNVKTLLFPPFALAVVDSLRRTQQESRKKQERRVQ